jgi:predicted nucleic acid-binding protein
MPPLALDVSVTLAWVLPDEDSVIADAALAYVQDDGAVVPALWWFELRNALVMAERRRGLTPVHTHQSLADIACLPIDIDTAPAETAVLTLARTYALSVYGAAYLELALRRAAPLATLDRALLRAATEAGAAIFTPPS